METVIDSAGSVCNVINAEGQLLGGGMSGIVELTDDGYATKKSWPARERSMRDMETEARIYEHLGSHPRLVKIISWDAGKGRLKMEYMVHGTLKNYIKDHDSTITMRQRQQWILQAAEGLEFLHSRHVWHCDFTPGNMLLDSDLELKVADFACSSLYDLKPSGVAAERYRRKDLKDDFLQSDIFAFGSTIYYIVTGHDIYPDVPTPEDRNFFPNQQYPDLRGVYFEEIIQSCWQGKFRSAQNVREAVESCADQQAGHGIQPFHSWLWRLYLKLLESIPTPILMY